MDVREKLVEILKQAPFEGKVLDEWWWDDIDDDASDADMNPLYEAITTVQDTLERLTYCSECKYFMQRDSVLGYCGRYNCRKLVFDFCSDGKVEEEEK